MLVIGGSAQEGEVMDEEKRQDTDGNVAHHYGGEAKNRSGDQSPHHQAVFNVIAFLECVIPEVECPHGRKDKSAKAETHRIEEVVGALYCFRPSQIPRAEVPSPPLGA